MIGDVCGSKQQKCVLHSQFCVESYIYIYIYITVCMIALDVMGDSPIGVSHVLGDSPIGSPW